MRLDDIKNGTDVDMNNLVEDNFPSNIIKEAIRPTRKILFGCSKRSFFCNANYENKNIKEKRRKEIKYDTIEKKN